MVLGSKEDIDKLNIIQCANAGENIYYLSHKLNIDYIWKIAKKIRPKDINTMDVIVKEDTAERRNELIISRQSEIKNDFSWSFLKIKKVALRWRDDFLKCPNIPAIIVRNSRLIEVYDEYHRKADSGIKMPHVLKYFESKIDLKNLNNLT